MEICKKKLKERSFTILASSIFLETINDFVSIHQQYIGRNFKVCGKYVGYHLRSNTISALQICIHKCAKLSTNGYLIVSTILATQIGYFIFYVQLV